MAVQRLNDGNRRAALVPFLHAADELRGLSVVFAVDKKIQQFGGFDDFGRGLEERNLLQAKWKKSGLERMLAVTHILSILIGVISMQGQSITWLSDADDLFASDLHKRDCSRMMGFFSGFYLRHVPGPLSISTTELDEGDRFEEDFAAIPDVAAGGVGELYNRIVAKYGKVPGIDFVEP